MSMDSINLLNFFKSVDTESALKGFISSKTKEDLHIEFKQKQDSRDGNLGERDKYNFSRALSGFANSDGGVLFWGIETSKKDESAKRLKPINEVNEFLRSLKSSLLTTVQPFVDGVLIERTDKLGSSTRGYVKCFIPASDKTPHRAMQAGREYYKRSVEEFYKMEHFDLEDMFGRRQKPNLELNVIVKKYDDKDPEMMEMAFSIKNDGRTMAQHYGFFAKFEGNINLIGSPDLSIQDVTKINNGVPSLSYSNDVGVIHPNGISYTCGSMRFKQPNKSEKIKGVVSYFCENMSSKAKNIEIG